MHGDNPSSGISWWQIGDVCEYLQMNESQIELLARKHGLPCRDFGRTRRYPRELVIEWAEAPIVLGERQPRKQRSDAGRPATVRRTAQAPSYLGVVPMAG